MSVGGGGQVERELGDAVEERRLLVEAIKRFPYFDKLYLMLGQLEERQGGPPPPSFSGASYACHSFQLQLPAEGLHAVLVALCIFIWCGITSRRCCSQRDRQLLKLLCESLF